MIASPDLFGGERLLTPLNPSVCAYIICYSAIEALSANARDALDFLECRFNLAFLSGRFLFLYSPAKCVLFGLTILLNVPDYEDLVRPSAECSGLRLARLLWSIVLNCLMCIDF